MISLLKAFFLNNWPRKFFSLLIAILVWYGVNQSLTTTITVSNVPVRIVNIPPGKTVEGIQQDDVLKKRIVLTITGNKSKLSEVSSSDFEVIIDASGKRNKWIEAIGKKNLHSLNPDLSVTQAISKVSRKSVSVELTKLVTEKIPITITQPIGEAPKGYKFLDIWPYQLFITVSGPENAIKKVKSRGVKLTFNLNDISKAQLDDLASKVEGKEKDVVSFFVPREWKYVRLPDLSQNEIEINDTNARHLRIDFLRNELIPIENLLPISLFFPSSTASIENPEKLSIDTSSPLILSQYGMTFIGKQLYASSVSELFVEVIRDTLELLLVIGPNAPNGSFPFTLQFVNHRTLEDKFVSMQLSDVPHDEHPEIREEYLRNRFRNFMNRMQLFQSDKSPFKIVAKQKGNKVMVTEMAQ